jgi:3-oxoacyl-[acyl-carrier-protein] synthase I
MTAPQGVFLHDAEMFTPVGENAVATHAAISAGICSYQESSIVSSDYLPTNLALIPDSAIPPVPPLVLNPITRQNRYQRLLPLAAKCLSDLIIRHEKIKSCPLFLSGPDSLHLSCTPIGPEIFDDLKASAFAGLDVAQCQLFTHGRPGGIVALEAAFNYLQQPGNQYCLVGGVDTYFDLAVLAPLIRDKRVKAPRCPDSFVPGEGAGFILLSKSPQNSSAVTISRPGFGLEPGHRYSQAPYQGSGLAEAWRQAIKDLPSKIQTLYSCANGESFASKELGTASIRNGNRFASNLLHQHPAEYWGDQGAATAILLISHAALDLLKGIRTGSSLISCSADGAERAAICLSLT